MWCVRGVYEWRAWLGCGGVSVEFDDGVQVYNVCPCQGLSPDTSGSDSNPPRTGVYLPLVPPFFIFFSA